MVPAVSHVEHDPPSPGGVNDRLHPTPVVEDAGPPAVEEVAHDVARTEQRQHLAVLRRRVVDVNDHGETHGLRSPDAPPQRLEPVRPDHLDLLAHLDPQDDVAVLARRGRRQVGVRIVEQAVFPDAEVGEPDRRDVEKREDPRLGAGHDVLAEPRDVRGARAPGVTERGHARRRAHRVGLDPQVVAGDERMGVEVDEPRDDMSARGVHDLPGRGGGDRPVHCRDAIRREGHVAAPVDARRGVDEVTTLQQKVIPHASRSFTSPVGTSPRRLAVPLRAAALPPRSSGGEVPEGAPKGEARPIRGPLRFRVGAAPSGATRTPPR